MERQNSHLHQFSRLELGVLAIVSVVQVQIQV